MVGQDILSEASPRGDFRLGSQQDLFSPPLWGIGFGDALEKSWRWFRRNPVSLVRETWLSLDGHGHP